MTLICNLCKLRVLQVWDANGDRWKLENPKVSFRIVQITTTLTVIEEAPPPCTNLSL